MRLFINQHQKYGNILSHDLFRDCFNFFYYYFNFFNFFIIRSSQNNNIIIDTSTHISIINSLI
jgi:hypothetical protein